jgi:hypothetical protein
MLSRKALLKKVNFPTPREEKVFWNLRKYGAPLSKSGAQGLDLTLEETLAEALVLSRRFPFVAQVWPVMFALNEEYVDLDVLEDLSRRLGYGAVLGFFLSLTRALVGDPEPTNVEVRLMDVRPENPEMFFLVDRSPLFVEFSSKMTPEVARDWNFMMATTLEHFQETFDTFTKRHA